MASRKCPDCGYTLSPFEKECPRCARLGPPPQNVTDTGPPAGSARSLADYDRPLPPAPGQQHATGSIGHLIGIAKADADNQVVETQEANNTYVATIQVTAN